MDCRAKDYGWSALLVVGDALTKALSRSSSCNLGLQTAAFPGLQIEGVLLCVGDDSLAGHLPLEAANCAFDALVVVNLYLCHSKPPMRLSSEKLTQRTPPVSISGRPE
jgi:hypothetical protein